MGAAILEQQEQLAYKESFPTTTEALFLYLDLSISNGMVSSEINEFI